MKLRGQQSGYAMAVLLVAMSIMALMMTVALPTWKQMSRREQEAELVFRGEQYARAIALFQLKAGPGTLPPSIDLLIDNHFLRKKYKDPITNDDFALILQTVAGAPGGAGAAGGRRGTAGTQAGGTIGQRGGGLGTTPAATTPAATPATPGAAPGATPGAAPSGGITGVTSKSKEQSIRLYKGRGHYNEWPFVPTPRVAAPGTATPGTTTPGGVGPGQRGNAPGGTQPGANPFGGRQNPPPPTGQPFGSTNPTSPR